MKVMIKTTLDLDYEEEGLNNTQSKLLKCINEHPGIRYRELSRLTELSNGVLTYHLSFLDKMHKLKIDRNNNNKITRYYPNNIPIEETSIIGYIRNNTARQIILFILQHDSCTFNEIIECTKKAPSTISWHLKRLKDAGIISVLYSQYQIYKVTNRELICDILHKYKQTFTDIVVNNYTDIIEEL
jgi:predicted transcriptional regulator